MPGALTFPILARLAGPGLAVTDDEALAAVALAFRHLRIVLEPGGAVSLAAALFRRRRDRGRRRDLRRLRRQRRSRRSSPAPSARDRSRPAGAAGAARSASRAGHAPLPLAFLMATMALDAIGIGLVFPVMPDLMAEVRRRRASADAALWGGVLATGFALMQFLCAPVHRRPLRPLRAPPGAARRAAADRARLRRPAALAHSHLAAARPAAARAAPPPRPTPPCNAAAADLTPPERRAQAFGLLGAAFMGGFILGPVLGGLLGEWGPRVPFWAAAGLALAQPRCSAGAVLPETVHRRHPPPLPRRPRQPARRARASVARLRGATPPPRRDPARTSSAFVAYGAIWAFWGKAAFGWSPFLIGASLAAYGLGGAWCRAGPCRSILRRLGERGTILWGLAFNVAFLRGLRASPRRRPGAAPWRIASARSRRWARWCCPRSRPASRASRPADAQGEVLGVAASTRSLAAVLGPLVLTGAFAWGGRARPAGPRRCTCWARRFLLARGA